MSYGGRRFGGGGGRFGDRSSGGPKPVETGKEYDVQITEISRQGDGIARIQGFVIFVKGGKVGQNAKVKVTNVGARFAIAEVVGQGNTAQQQTIDQSEGNKKSDVAPAVKEGEKPSVQDYQSEEKQ